MPRLRYLVPEEKIPPPSHQKKKKKKKGGGVGEAGGDKIPRGILSPGTR